MLQQRNSQGYVSPDYSLLNNTQQEYNTSYPWPNKIRDMKALHCRVNSNDTIPNKLSARWLTTKEAIIFSDV